jgi:hypothetical protein
MSVFQQILAEIAEKIQVAQNFTVSHPNYPPRELRPEIIDRFKQTSPQLQRKYLTLQVQNYLYDIYFSHSLMSIAETTIAAQTRIQSGNNKIDGIDINFYQQLQRSNSSTGYFDPDWQIVAQTEAGELIVVKDGLHLHIDRDRHLHRDVTQSDIGSIVPIYLPHNQVGRDTYVIIGNLGTPAHLPEIAAGASISVRVYFNFTSDAAVSISARLTERLNQLGIPFQFNILHDPTLFDRYDAGTLWLTQTSYLEIQTVLAEIYQAHQAEFSADIPLFTKQLASGLGIAEVPTGSDSLSFGMHRCGLLATGSISAMTPEPLATSDKLSLIYREFTAAAIDLQQPYLNPGSIDRYYVF